MNLDITKHRYFALEDLTLRLYGRSTVSSNIIIINQPSKQQIFSSNFFFLIKSISYGEKFLIDLF